MEEKKRTRVKFSKVLYYILLVIFAGTFCVSLFLLGRYWLKISEVKAESVSINRRTSLIYLVTHNTL